MTRKYNLISSAPPVLPKKLPGFVKNAIAPVPSVMKAAAANAIFPPAAALMKCTKFMYVDNVPHEPTMMEGVVAPSGLGKGYLDPMKEAIITSLRVHDAASREAMEKYAEAYKKCGANQQKPDRPKDAAILVPEPDMSNPALIQLLKDAERAGGLSIYCDIPELEMLNCTCGGHKKVTTVIRANFDTKNYGAQRATVDGVSGNPKLRWKFNFAATEKRAVQFFKDGVSDGTLGRIGISYVPKTADGTRGIPHQGKYDEKYMAKLKPYLDRLGEASGCIKVSRANTLFNRLILEIDDIAILSEDDDFKSLSNRSLIIAWLKACILYVSEGNRWSPEIEEFVEWSLYYDLWSKVALFAPQWRRDAQSIEIDPVKFGPANMLDMLGKSFSRDQLEKLRDSLGKSKDGINQLTTWQSRGYITYDPATQLYTKTEEYLKNHPQRNV